MKRVLAYSALLLTGMGISHGFDLSPYKPALEILTQVCLAVIMIEAGLEFSADIRHPRTYAVDAMVATAASALPWILSAVYFYNALQMDWKPASLLACFAAPTSAGVLFTLLAAAGLSRTWVFRKARVLAVFDDLATLLLLVPLQMMIVGWKPELLVTVTITVGLIYAGYRWVNQSEWPVDKPWLLLYGILLWAIGSGFHTLTRLHLEILLPAFVMGCILRHRGIVEGDDPHSVLDQGIKGLFLLLVGCAIPRFSVQGMDWMSVAGHVLALTVIGNLGKCVPFFFYRNEVSARDRAALSVAMFPRGEVGAGVLLLAMRDGVGEFPLIVGSLSLALNLTLTGVFILGVKRLIKS